MQELLDLDDVSSSSVGTGLGSEEGVLFDLALVVHRLDDLEGDIDSRLLAC